MYFLKSRMTIKDSSESKDINKAAKILKKGGVVIFPTDTVYGIGCRYDNHQAIGRIHKIKGTPDSQNFPILISDLKQIESLVEINDLTEGLVSRFWPGALTIILKSVSSDQKIGLRMPNSKITKELIKKVGVPIIGTSANFHGDNSPTKFEDLDPKFIKLADYVIEGDCSYGVESTIVDVTEGEMKVIRLGALRLHFDKFQRKRSR